MNESEILSLKKALEEERIARKLAEQKCVELEENFLRKESEFRGVYDNLNDAFVLIDLFGNVLKMNSIAEALFGYTYDENNPLNLLKLVHKDDFKYTQEAFRKLMKFGKYSKYRSRIIANGNIEKILEVNCILVRDKDNSIIGVQGIARDVSQEIEVQELLEQHSQRITYIWYHFWLFSLQVLADEFHWDL